MSKLVIAHRGASRLAPENSLLAFQKAIEIGADMIELDVRRSNDGVLLVNHDPKIGNRKISATIFSLLVSFKPDLATLEEALALIKGRIKLDVEIKEAGHEDEAVELLLKFLSPENFIITSFHSGVINFIKQKYPKVQVGLLITGWKAAVGESVKYKTFAPIKDKMSRPVAYDFMAPRWDLKCDGKNKLVWTVNDLKLIKEFLLDPSVSGIITDVPEAALNIRRGIMQNGKQQG